MPEMVQRQRGIWNYVALRVVALQRPRERLLAGIDPTATLTGGCARGSRFDRAGRYSIRGQRGLSR